MGHPPGIEHDNPDMVAGIRIYAVTEGLLRGLEEGSDGILDL
jgi:hypothetical protein